MRYTVMFLCALLFLLFSIPAFASPVVSDVPVSMAYGGPGDDGTDYCMACTNGADIDDTASTLPAIPIGLEMPLIGADIRENNSNAPGSRHAFENQTVQGVAAPFTIPV